MKKIIIGDDLEKPELVRLFMADMKHEQNYVSEIERKLVVAKENVEVASNNLKNELIRQGVKITQDTRLKMSSIHDEIYWGDEKDE